MTNVVDTILSFILASAIIGLIWIVVTPKECDPEINCWLLGSYYIMESQ